MNWFACIVNGEAWGFGDTGEVAVNDARRRIEAAKTAEALAMVRSASVREISFEEAKRIGSAAAPIPWPPL
jgi:hypothetical protein